MRLRLPPTLASGLVLAALLAGPAPARAVTLLFSIDPSQSSVSQGDTSAPLAGLISLELAALPPVGSNTAMDVVGLVASAGGLGGLLVGLDDALTNPGLGVLFPDGTFLIPSLHLEVNGTDLTVSEVVGTLGPSAPCAFAACFALATAFDVEPDAGPLFHVTVVAGAAVPEPAPAALAGLALACGALVGGLLPRGALVSNLLRRGIR